MITVLPQNLACEYRSPAFRSPPPLAQAVRECSAQDIFQAACQNRATLWQGDYHNAKQVLAALKKRLRKPPKPAATPAEAFHKHRLAQSQAARGADMLLVRIDPGFELRLPRAPDVAAALAAVYGEANREPFLLPLNQLLGFIGAWQWQLNGVDTGVLPARIHVPYGVFSPLRGEYLQLIAQAPLPANAQTAWDIGTGSGVLALLLHQRGLRNISATDTNPRAIAAARANFARAGADADIRLLEQDLFPQGHADLIVCNPPWLPAKPTSELETALYDPGHAMLRALLAGARERLTPQGQLWLVMSDLAEHLGLREPQALAQWFQAAGLRLANHLQTAPQHPKAADDTDPLAFARRRERTSLYILEAENGQAA